MSYAVDATKPHVLPVEEAPRMLTVEQARKLAGVGRHLAYELVRNGTWPSQRWGEAIRIPKARFYREVLQEEEPS